MTLGTTETVDRYDGDNSTTVFNVTFEFHAATDLEVIVVTELTGAESLKSLGGDYSVSGGDGGTGQVTMTVAPTTAERLVIRRGSEDVQPDDLIDGGALAAEPLERRLDIIVARLQELETDIARSLKVAKGSMAPESGLTLNLTGGMGNSLQVAADELGVIIAAATAPATAVLSVKGEEFVGLADEAAMRTFLTLSDAAITALGTSGATIPLLNGNNTFSGTATFSADATFGSDLIVNAPFVLQSEVLTIDTGAITPTKSDVRINNEGAASTDNLDTINVANHPFGSVIQVRAGTSGQVPTLRHDVGNIYLAGNANVALDDLDKVISLQRRDTGQGEHGAGWYEIGRSAIREPQELKCFTIDETTISTSTAAHAVTWNNADGWKKIEILISDMAPVADAILRMRLSSNGGSSYDAGASDYLWQQVVGRAAAAALGDNLDDAIDLSADLLVEATSGRLGLKITIANPTSSAANPTVIFDGGFADSNGTHTALQGAGWRLTDQETDGYQLTFNGQNIATAHVLTIGWK